MTGQDTRQTLLDAAEVLFAENGYAATSMRQLTTTAGANLAAVNYHFGSKEELTKAVLARRIEPINAERRRRLDLLQRPGARRCGVREILLAFVEPPLQTIGPRGHAQVACRMFGRISIEQPHFLHDFLQAQFGDVARRFTAALAAASPELDAKTVSWRLHFAIGAMAHVLQNAPTISHMTKGLCDPQETDVLVEQLVCFLSGGFGTLPTAKKTAKKTVKKAARSTTQRSSNRGKPQRPRSKA